jgi:Tol biopolymer transport system component
VARGAGSAVFSPDGKTIAYEWQDAQRPNEASLRTVGLEAEARPRVVFDDRGYVSVTPYDWSPDGASILVKRSIGSELPARGMDIAWISVADGTARVLKAVPPRPAPQVFQPRVSSDGQYIAYREGGRILILQPDGTEVVVAEGLNQIWAADGSHLLFLVGNERTREQSLYAVAIRNGHPVGVPKLVKANVNMELVGVSLSGALHHFAGSGGSHVFVAARDPNGSGGTPQVLETFPGSNPVWSPDGRSVAFTRSVGETQYNLVVRTLDSGEERLYSRQGFSLGQPSWFHDGSRILVALGESAVGAPNSGAFYTLNLRTGGFDQLFPTHTADRRVSGTAAVAISLDDRTVFLPAAPASSPNNAGMTLMIAVDLATRTERVLFTFPAGSPLRGPSVSLHPNGRSLLVGTNDPSQSGIEAPAQASLFQIDIDGTNYRPIHGPFPTAVNCAGTCGWTPDGRSVVFEELNAAAGAWRIMRVPAEGGTPQLDGIDSVALKQVHPALVPGMWANSISVNPDGRRIAFSHVTSSFGLWALDNAVALLASAR